MNKIEIIEKFNKIEGELQSLIEKLLTKCYYNRIAVGNIHIDVYTSKYYIEQTEFEINCNLITENGEQKIKILVSFNKVEVFGEEDFIFADYDTSNENAKELRDYLFDVD
jgi:2-oxoglutarate dehydrogenase complex dehydrogenase (E1) component-like enzyme